MSDGATTTLLWMCAGLLPLTVAEFLLQACVAKRTLRPVLLIRDFVTPMSLLLVALGLHAAGAGRAGIGAAYFASNALACLGAVVAFSRTFRGHGLPAGPMRSSRPICTIAAVWPTPARAMRHRDETVLVAARRREVPIVLSLGGGYADPLDASIEAHVNTYRAVRAIFPGV